MHVPALLLLVLAQTCLALRWRTVYEGQNLSDDAVTHMSFDNGVGRVCRRAGWASGRTSPGSGYMCYLPSGHKQHLIRRPFEVLEVDPAREKAVWRYTSDAAEIRRRGVKVKADHRPEPEMYVCASPTHGPGKLVIWSGERLVCYVADHQKELELTEGFQVLTIRPL